MDEKSPAEAFLALREDEIQTGVDGKIIKIQLLESYLPENIYGLKEFYVYFVFDKHIYSPVRKTTSFAFAENAYNFIFNNPEVILNETHNLFMDAIEKRKSVSLVKSGR